MKSLGKLSQVSPKALEKQILGALQIAGIGYIYTCTCCHPGQLMTKPGCIQLFPG